MGYIQDELAKRNIPDLLTFKDGTRVTSKSDWEKRRDEIVDILSTELFGKLPPALHFETEQIFYSEKTLGSKIFCTTKLMKFKTDKGEAEFPFYQILPKNKPNCPLFIHIAFKPSGPWLSCPVERIIDRGYGIIMAYYEDITSDDGDFTTGIAKLFCRDEYNCGKISLWSWAMSRLMDYAQTLDSIDKSRIAMLGQSRLGKTALWTVANDHRFAYTCANSSGYAGDAISRGKIGETVEKIYNRFPYWFVPEYGKYANNEDKMPFDQHFLVAASAPSKVCTGASVLDEWADPESQFLSCAAASPVYELLGMKGFVANDRPTVPGDTYQEGSIGHHLRSNGHTLSIYDWERYMDFIDKN